MIKQLTLFCTFAIFMAAFLGFSVSAFAGKDCVSGDTRPKCNPGSGGDDHGDPPAQYCAQLTKGGFHFGGVPGTENFGKVTLTRNNKGNAYNSPYGLLMVRPANPDPDFSSAAWDAVFKTCPVLSGAVVTDLAVSDWWEIGNGGGKSAGEEGTPVTVSFKDAYGSPYDHIEVDLHLRGVLPAKLPLAGDEPNFVDIELDVFWFYVHASGTDSCKIITTFEKEGAVHSVLKMTWGECPPPPPDE